MAIMNHNQKTLAFRSEMRRSSNRRRSARFRGRFGITRARGSPGVPTPPGNGRGPRSGTNVPDRGNQLTCSDGSDA